MEVATTQSPLREDDIWGTTEHDDEEVPFLDMQFDGDASDDEDDETYTPSEDEDAEMNFESDDDELLPAEQVDTALWPNLDERHQWVRKYERQSKQWMRKYGSRIDSEARPEASHRFRSERRWKPILRVSFYLGFLICGFQWWHTLHVYQGAVLAPAEAWAHLQACAETMLPSLYSALHEGTAETDESPVDVGPQVNESAVDGEVRGDTEEATITTDANSSEPEEPTIIAAEPLRNVPAHSNDEALLEEASNDVFENEVIEAAEAVHEAEEVVVDSNGDIVPADTDKPVVADESELPTSTAITDEPVIANDPEGPTGTVNTEGTTVEIDSIPDEELPLDDAMIAPTDDAPVPATTDEATAPVTTAEQADEVSVEVNTGAEDKATTPTDAEATVDLAGDDPPAAASPEHGADDASLTTDDRTDDAVSMEDRTKMEAAITACADGLKAMVRERFKPEATTLATAACEGAVASSAPVAALHQQAWILRGDLKNFVRDFAGAEADYSHAESLAPPPAALELKLVSTRWLALYEGLHLDALRTECQLYLERNLSAVGPLRQVATDWLLVLSSHADPQDKRHLVSVLVQTRKITMLR
ncbi:hypothetical protein ACHHYP_01557 [Achlya hypogyna]|uniref:Uncharacterized protein n=1 Tax=Achlya hypogyna TaxID=1202772 RepID=A0A1V9Z8D8_ACHHY|nr:hypothetical protein ACHHYP_01557 [Achlya hypogyna]